jgi:dsDNA-specific endonuclease/ATPase MutS2
MQQMYPRTNPVTPQNSNVIAASQLEEALRNSVRQNAIDIRNESENTTDINSLVQRVAGVSLDELDDAIMELRQLRDFLHSESERIRREISGYLQLNHIAVDSTKSIVENIVQLRTATHKITRAAEACDFVGSEISPPPSAAAKDVFIPAK